LREEASGMKKDRLDKPYYFLTPEERFRLSIEALSRGDEAEVKRLDENCLRETYSMNQAAYTDRCRASKEMVDVICSALDPRLAELKVIEAFEKTLPYVFDICFVEMVCAYFEGHEAGSRRAWAAAGMKGDPPGWREQDEEPEMNRELESLRKITSLSERASEGFLSHLAELERGLLEEVTTIWEAFSEFCIEELRLEPEKLVKVWSESMLPQIEKLKKAPDPPDVDPEELKEWKEVLQQGWRTFS
jgi:hypothetical protein